MKKQRIVFIDSDINIDYINKIVKGRQSIGGVWTVANNKVIPSMTCSQDTLSHATLCSKMFFEHITCACELFFINIWEGDELKANINALLAALSWCLKNEVTLINLSLGTTLILDIPPLFQVINKLIEKNIIIVAASSNERKLTFPAAFDHVIGVKALSSKSAEVGFIYQENSLDLIEISCYVKDEVIEYQGNYYPLYAANSLAAPMISAKICNLLSKGYESIEEIKVKLKEQSLPASYQQDDKIYQQYFKQEIEIPVIAVINDHHGNSFDIPSLIQKLLTAFSEQDYHGICLSEKRTTNLVQKTLNLTNFEGYSLIEKLHFYTHYCNVDYVIVEGSHDFLLNNFKAEDLDILLHHSEFSHFKEEKKAPSIVLLEDQDFDVLFNQLYHRLSEE